jgi:hypothetical protein
MLPDYNAFTAKYPVIPEQRSTNTEDDLQVALDSRITSKFLKTQIQSIGILFLADFHLLIISGFLFNAWSVDFQRQVQFEGISNDF